MSLSPQESGSPRSQFQLDMCQDSSLELLTLEDRRKLARMGSNIGKRSSTLKRRNAYLGVDGTYVIPPISKSAEAKLQKAMSGKKTPESPTRR